MSVAIKFENISKQYRLGEVGTGTLSHDLHRVWARLRGKPDPFAKVGAVNDRTQSSTKNQEQRTKHGGATDYVWALRDINFEVQQGEILGIIGRNGAGKSTLLKILSRVTAPTTGRIKSRGRIASLLEVGTGFHPELTGRENIYLNGAILGMRRHEITKQLEEIVEFSGCAKYIETPVKRYSSGMTVRLGFAVAAHLDCEILVIDEVLAVGDAEFQRKCIGKMGDVARLGKTVLFVSHNMIAVRSLCHRAIQLTNGFIERNGDVSNVVAEYLQFAGNNEPRRKWSEDQNAPGNDIVRLLGISITSVSENPFGNIEIDSAIAIEVSYRRLIDNKSFHLTFHLVNQDEVVVLTTSPGSAPPESGTYTSNCIVPAPLLNSGGYRVKILIVEDGSRVTWVDESLVSFTVEDLRERSEGWMGREPSAIQIPLNWQTAPTRLFTNGLALLT